MFCTTSKKGKVDLTKELKRFSLGRARGLFNYLVFLLSFSKLALMIKSILIGSVNLIKQ